MEEIAVPVVPSKPSVLSGFRKEGYHELCQITFLLLCWLNNIYFQVDFTPKYF